MWVDYSDMKGLNIVLAVIVGIIFGLGVLVGWLFL